MRVLYCYRYGILGGVCTQLRNRLEYLHRLPGFEAEIVFGKDCGIGTCMDGLAMVHRGIELQGLRSWVSRRGFDIVAIIDTPEFFDALAPEPRPYKVVAEVHTSIPKSLAYLTDRSWEADAFVVPSLYMKKLLTDTYRVSAERAPLIAPNSLDTDLFRPVPVGRLPGHPILGWVGKIDDHKNWRAFAELCGRLESRGVEFEAWLCGGQTCPEQRALEMLQTFDAEGVMHRFRWFDRVENHGMPAFYSAIAASGGCKVITSRCESFGMSMLEALLCGCPVVSAEVGALPELAPAEPFATFYPLCDMVAAERAVIGMLRPDRARAARERLDVARTELAARYSLPATGAAYHRLLQSVLGRGSPAGPAALAA